MKIRVKLIREYAINRDRVELEDEIGLEPLEKIEDMEELGLIDDYAWSITTRIDRGSVEVIEDNEEIV